ncbi:hypothetical protein M5D96_011690 [Drosophila gunungcola]|uniref:HTH OST-type domain-containing protein n=1 Tax=Drosophila gunungcola TaxID=103775 RepID=A0A9P9YEH5_9MUSC|nr:hypothetical protein M5D96_011690 [Drosophila gunungcola]
MTIFLFQFAKQVVSNLHRKKIGHKRMLVSYTRDSSLTEVKTLRCQVAGLLKDVPYYALPMYKFRELFQSRFKTSISVLDLYKMQDICTINSDINEDKFISLKPELVNTLESSPLMEGLQHSVPYCKQHKGWAEQEIEPLPNVHMTISEIQKLIYPLLRVHPGDIPVATLLHCIKGQLKASIVPNESGVNLEHLVCCVQGIQIQINNFGWLELSKDIPLQATGSSNANSLNVSDRANCSGGSYFKNSVADPLFQISREVIELVKMSPKSTMKFNRFIPAYHNHFGKQCRIMGDGENRQITLTHRTQIRRFTSDLLRVLRAYGNNSVLLSQLPGIFSQAQNRSFDVTDYGVCDIADILDGLVNSNIVVLSNTSSELEKTSVFAGEMVELLKNSLQYSVQFQKFVRSYHYHFAYQCRLSDYGFLKLADLMDAIHGLVEIELTNDEDKKIILSPKYVRLTGFMRLLIAIVCMLEQRPSMYLCDIKNALDTDFASFFEFGFPNLYSVIAAHEDLFTVNNGPTQERSDVSLNPNCESQGSFRTPIDEHNNLLPTQSPQSSLSMANDYAKTVVNACNFKFNNFQFYDDLFATDNYIIPPLANSFIDSSLLNSFGSALESENSMNSSSQLLNSSLNSSNELNVSLGAGDLANVTSSTAISSDTLYDHSSFKLCHRRNSCFNKLCKNMPIHLDSDTDETCNLKLPFWNDPIWSARSDQPRHNILNIRLPELKTNNMFPILLSPYTISKNENLKRKLFNFENHVRKIA